MACPKAQLSWESQGWIGACSPPLRPALCLTYYTGGKVWPVIGTELHLESEDWG